MSVVVYPALVTAANGGFEVRFVDLPELLANATTQPDLIRIARERLTVELQRREREEESWPEPTRLTDVAPPAGASVVLVDVSVDDTPTRLTISLGERLLRRIDQDAEARSMTRSGYLALGARRLLEDAAEPRGGEAGETGRKLQEEVAALGRRMNEAIGPESPVGRTLAELDAMALDGLRKLGGEMNSRLRSGRRTQREPAPDNQRPASPNSQSADEAEQPAAHNSGVSR